MSADQHAHIMELDMSKGTLFCEQLSISLVHCHTLCPDLVCEVRIWLDKDIYNRALFECERGGYLPYWLTDSFGCLKLFRLMFLCLSTL